MGVCISLRIALVVTKVSCAGVRWCVVAGGRGGGGRIVVDYIPVVVSVQTIGSMQTSGSIPITGSLQISGRRGIQRDVLHVQRDILRVHCVGHVCRCPRQRMKLVGKAQRMGGSTHNHRQWEKTGSQKRRSLFAHNSPHKGCYLRRSTWSRLAVRAMRKRMERVGSGRGRQVVLLVKDEGFKRRLEKRRIARAWAQRVWYWRTKGGWLI